MPGLKPVQAFRNNQQAFRNNQAHRMIGWRLYSHARYQQNPELLLHDQGPRGLFDA